MADLVRVQIVYSVETPYGTFTDCLYKTPAEYAALKEADKEAEKQARVADYVSAIQNAPVPKAPKLDELIEDKKLYERLLSEVDAKISAAGGTLEAVPVDEELQP